ncbi:B3GN3 acetylglucosaminyltransferase, partial [Polypterus senegalus]
MYLFFYFFLISEMKRINRRLEFIALLLFGSLGLLILLFTDNSDDLLEVPESETAQSMPKRHTNGDQATTPQSSKCKMNTSVAKIPEFTHFNEPMKEFLRFRHCRNFPILLDAPEKCGKRPQDSSKVFLLLMIKSSPLNYDRREVIRKTWGKERLQNGVWIRRIFVSGVPQSNVDARRYSSLLQIENEQHNDILQFDFIDTFYNLTLKQTLFLGWLETQCPHAHFLFNGDDDVFANTENMVLFLKGLKDNDGSEHLFMGFLVIGNGPIRDAYSKYFVPAQIYESHLFPPYCSGGGILLSMFTAKAIYKVLHAMEIFPIDDVFLGMCLEKAGLQPMSHRGILTLGFQMLSNTFETFDPCFYRELLLVHSFLPHEAIVMWEKIHNPQIKCGTLMAPKLPV